MYATVDGRKLYRARTNAGITREEMAQLFGVGMSSIANIENGHNKITSDKLYTWAKVCHVEVIDLYMRLK